MKKLNKYQSVKKQLNKNKNKNTEYNIHISPTEKQSVFHINVLPLPCKIKLFFMQQ